MARTFAPLLVAVWNDPDFLALDEGPQRIYFVANSQANMTYCGVVPFMPVSWSGLAGNSSAGKIRRDVKVLEDKNFVVLDRQTEELWVKSFIKHNNVMSQPNVIKAMKASYETIRSAKIKRAVYQSVPKDARDGMTDPFGKPPPKAEPQPEPQSKGFTEGNGKPLDPTQGLGSKTSNLDPDLDLASEPEPSPSPQPEPPPEPKPVTPTAPVAHDDPRGMTAEEAEIASHKALNRKVLEWTDRVMDRFGWEARKATATSSVMRMALVYLDEHLVDECIGYCAQLEDKPQTPAYLRKTLVSWAAQRGIEIPDIPTIGRQQRAS